MSLLDNIDTFLDSSSNDIAPFKAILNDMYSKDMSKKSAVPSKARKNRGCFWERWPRMAIKNRRKISIGWLLTP